MARVLVVTSTYPVPDNPQAGGFIHRQICNLAETGVDCHVLVFRPGPPPFPRWLGRRTWLRYFWLARGWPARLDGIPVDVVFYQRAWTADEDVVPSIGDALVRHVKAHPELGEFDAIYAHWLWTAGAASLALREHFGWPLVAIARGSEMHEWQSIRRFCRAYVERVLREADCILANCEDLRSRADEHVPGSASRIDVVYNGCDASVFRPAADREAVRRAVGLEPHSRALLFCGDVCTRKGIAELAEAWHRFSARHAEWRLVIVGKIIEPQLAAQLRTVGRGRVTFAGRLPRERVIAWLQAADAYVQPSRLEGLANATMEAMASGLPVITTDTCGQGELIRNGENGWLVPVGDVASLDSALESLVSDPARARRMGLRARETILTRFDPKTATARLSSILASFESHRMGSAAPPHRYAGR